ncbi:hypothetical protein [Pelagicoccus sp. SDUM812002]|uniref:hypothetical protein n=1 Tax=Pelagicoccus sp. SDUM812002 TaxID=3041266 RepID=UPI00280E0236|nr:hypothetical protein [Pelagicoccus sp. SDUM812002]MDQ8186386.1 hypothetical protein [Pelagicoccus sp. SDUM812002]
MRKITPILIAALMLLSAGLASQVHAHRPPAPEHTSEARLSSSDIENYSAELSYQSVLISIEGEIFVNTDIENLRFKGQYHTRQKLDDEVRLAFQVYSKNGDMVFLDGERTELLPKEQGHTAAFDYSYQLGTLNVPNKHKEFYIRFNYVREGEYWADMKYPNMELPSFFVSGLERSEILTPILSYFPTLIPEKKTSYSLHLFRSEKKVTGPFKHRATAQVKYVEDGGLDNNRRYEIKSDTKGKDWHVSLISYRLDRVGEVQRRLGFVWDGVQWYPQANDQFKTSYSVSAGLYLLVNAIAVLIASLPFYFARTVIRGKWLYVLASAISLLVLAEFPTLDTLLFALVYVSICLGHKILSTQRALYWVLLAYVVANEFIWGHIVPVGPTELAPFLLSISIAALAMAPITLMSRPWAKLITGNLAFLAIASFYATMAIYYLFFDDYPSLNVLTYASQATDLLDSITSYFDSRFSTFATTSAIGLLATNLAASSSPCPTDRQIS